jgi:hypothetical protein
LVINLPLSLIPSPDWASYYSYDIQGNVDVLVQDINRSGFAYNLAGTEEVGADTSIKLPDYAVEILQRYKLKGGKLLPHFNNTNLNKYLKTLVELAGFIQPIGKHRDKLGMHTEVLKLDGLKKTAIVSAT